MKGPRAGTVRFRTTVGALLVVGIALTLASFALVLALRQSLTREVRAVARLRAFKVAAAVEAAGDPRKVPLPTGDEQLVQILDESGRVVASGKAIEGLPPLAGLKPGESANGYLLGDDDLFVTIAAEARTEGGNFTVLAATLNDVTGPTQILTNLLIAGVPVLLLVVGLTTYRVVGRALAPVEAIRGEVDEISGAQLHRRVPKPPGKDEISKLAATMNLMLDRLEESQKKQRQFVSDASHELRSPVASIRQHAEVALAHPDQTNLGELAQTVLAENMRAKD
ncbi:MAG: HAMP domain-containing protein [Actinomycetota bacterium]